MTRIASRSWMPSRKSWISHRPERQRNPAQKYKNKCIVRQCRLWNSIWTQYANSSCTSFRLESSEEWRYVSWSDTPVFLARINSSCLHRERLESWCYDWRRHCPRNESGLPWPPRLHPECHPRHVRPCLSQHRGLLPLWATDLCHWSYTLLWRQCSQNIGWYRRCFHWLAGGREEQDQLVSDRGWRHMVRAFFCQ